MECRRGKIGGDADGEGWIIVRQVEHEDLVRDRWRRDVCQGSVPRRDLAADKVDGLLRGNVGGLLTPSGLDGHGACERDGAGGREGEEGERRARRVLSGEHDGESTRIEKERFEWLEASLCGCRLVRLGGLW